MELLERKEIASGAFVTVLDAEKFNRCHITVHLRYPANRASATDAAVLRMVLERGYAACPDMTQLTKRLARLYGADLGVDLASVGCDHILSADICGLKDRFALAGESLAAEYAAMVLGVLFDPYLINGVFDPQAVAIEKETLRRRLQNEFNDKRLYCTRQARRRFFGDSPAGVETCGNIADLPHVTPQTLKAEYDRILSQAVIDVVVQGAAPELVESQLQQYLAGRVRTPENFASPVAMPRRQPEHVREGVAGLTQAKLCMMFTRGTAEDLPSIHALRLAAGVFGGSVTGRLFRNVREKQSLCYFCSATAQRGTGTMSVDSGVEPQNAARAEAAILHELKDICDGNLTQEELDDCRRSLLSGMASVPDTLSGLEYWYYGQISRGEPMRTPAQEEELVKAVTRQEVSQVLQGYSYSLCYALTTEQAAKEAQA